MYGILHACTSVYACCMSVAQRGHKKALDPLKEELQVVVGHHVSAGNQTRVLCESSRHSLPLLRHFSNPSFWCLRITAGETDTDEEDRQPERSCFWNYSFHFKVVKILRHHPLGYVPANSKLHQKCWWLSLGLCDVRIYWKNNKSTSYVSFIGLVDVAVGSHRHFRYSFNYGD